MCTQRQHESFARNKCSKYLYAIFLERQREVAPPQLLDHNRFDLTWWGKINDTFLRMCLKWDCLSSRAGTLPGKILTVGFNAPSHEPKHVYLFSQFKRTFSPPVSLAFSFPPPLSLSVINFMGISMEFFCDISDCVGSHMWGWDAFLGEAGVKWSPLCYFSVFFNHWWWHCNIWMPLWPWVTLNHVDSLNSTFVCFRLCNRRQSNNKSLFSFLFFSFLDTRIGPDMCPVSSREGGIQTW